jgi:8-oxo-dGTP diphosphatase
MLRVHQQGLHKGRTCSGSNCPSHDTSPFRPVVARDEVATVGSMHLAADGRPLVAACYIVRNGRLLMVKRRIRNGAPEWTGPSGNVEPGETPEEAAVREVAEEVGLTVAVSHRLGERVHPATGRHLIYIVCECIAGEAAVVDHEEITAIEWCDVATVFERWGGLEGGIYPPVREYLERVLASTAT